MAGGTIWKGYIHFGEIDVPVKLHTAVREERIQFHLLHNRDQVRLRQQMICAYERQPVPAEEQTKGFEVEDGKYIIIDPEELEQTVPEGNRMIEVHEFVKTEQIVPLPRSRLLPGAGPSGKRIYRACQGFEGDGRGRYLHLDHEKAVLSRGLAGMR
jgi:non-homologous end joining protein Ku